MLQPKKIIGIVLIGLCVFLFSIVLLRQRTTDTEKRHRIAIFEPALHPAIDEISRGFMDTMSDSQDRYEFKRFNANGNKMLMQAQAQEALHAGFDLLFTIGVGCSVAVK